MSLRVFDNLEEIPAAAWDRLTSANFPFADHAYLRALETSGSVGKQAGWNPIYLTSWEGDVLRGAVFLYLKDNSYGEYIFDWAWLRAYHENGVPYFPKLVAAVPFTPASGPKILVAPEATAAEVRAELVAGVLSVAQSVKASSAHFLFTDADEMPALHEQGFLLRHSYQYHWRNRDFRTFEDFLEALKSRKRKAIRQEREAVRAAGITVEVVEGEGLTPELATTMHGFYESTIAKMGAIAYLTLDFFQTVFSTLRDRIVLMLARREGEVVAGAIYYRKGNALFGRYWGCREDVRNLHFELCYYQGIEYAIARQIQLFEAGAQGEHKLARGFLPQLTFSAHWIQHPSFRAAIAEFIEREKMGIAELFAEYAPHLPYRETP